MTPSLDSAQTGRDTAPAPERARELALLNRHHMETLGRLAAGITHEINTPLTYIKGNVELLRAEMGRTLPPERIAALERFLGPIADGAERIAATVESMKEVTGILRPFKSVRDVNIYSTVVYAARLLYTQIKHTSPFFINAEPFALGMPADGEVINVRLRDANIEQVWLVLFNNAIEAFGPSALPFEERRIEVTAARSGERVSVTVRDNAGPIPEDALKDMFSLFQTTKEGGSGVGLHVARAIIEGLGGTISARNEGGWAVFETVL